MTHIIAVRHGETVWNAEGRMQGNLDSPLNEQGLEQAEHLAEQLATEQMDAFYCSDLGRARQTAAALARRIGKDPVLLESLRERHLGLFQGLTGAECAVRYPKEYRRFQARESHAVPEGESLHALHERVRNVFSDLVNRHEGERIVVITHGGVLDMLHRFVRGKSIEGPRNFTLKNAAINRISHEAGVWRIEEWGVGAKPQQQEKLADDSA